MVGAIAQQMRQWIANEFDELTVEFGVGAFGDEMQLLLQVDSQFAHQPGQAREEPADGLHPRPHHRVL